MHDEIKKIYTKKKKKREITSKILVSALGTEFLQTLCSFAKISHVCSCEDIVCPEVTDLLNALTFFDSSAASGIIKVNIKIEKKLKVNPLTLELKSLCFIIYCNLSTIDHVNG